MSFTVAADSYDRFMGRFSVPLAPLFVEFAGIQPPMRVLDVGCGPGGLTSELVARLGADSVCAVDPSDGFVSTARERHPGVDIRNAVAEQLPFSAATFDCAVAQLVVHFMSDPVAGLREMGRITKPGGVVAACVWDNERGANSLLWQAARTIDSAAPGEDSHAGTRQGDLERLFLDAGMTPGADSVLTVSCHFTSFEEWWEPFTLGVGRAGGYVAGLDPKGRGRLRDRCRHLLPRGPFVLRPRAWAVRARAEP